MAIEHLRDTHTCMFVEEALLRLRCSGPLKVLQCRHTHFSSSCHAYCRPRSWAHTRSYIYGLLVFFFSFFPPRLLGWPTVRILDAPHIQPGHDERPQHMRSSKLIAARSQLVFPMLFLPPPPHLFGLATNLQQVGQVKKHLKYIRLLLALFFPLLLLLLRVLLIYVA